MYIIKSMVREISVWVRLTYNLTCVFDIIDHNDHGYTGFEPALSVSAQELKQSALTVRPRRHFLNKRNGKCIDARSNDITTGHEWAVKMRASVVYLQLKLDEKQKDY